MQLTLVTEDGSVTTANVQPTDPVTSLARTIATSLSIPPPEQRLLHNSAPINPATTFLAAGIGDGDLIMVLREQPTQPPPPNPTPALANSATGGPHSHSFSTQVRSNPALMSRLRAQNPSLAARIEASDPAAEAELAAFLRQAAASALQFMPGLGTPPTGVTGNALGGAGGGGGGDGEGFDPMSADAQRAIEERIRAENVQQNMEAALEHNPESFGRVVMLFVDCKINSADGLKAFVDSGAQTTIVSKSCAERCNILRLLDTRFAGVARGVGTAKIYGRIHLALLTLGAEVFEISLTVMDNVGSGYDVLLGLDMLRKHAAVIDLGANVLRIGGQAVPFLAEKDIPLAMRDSDPANEEDSAPASSGENASVATGGGAPGGDGGANPTGGNASGNAAGNSAPSSAGGAGAANVDKEAVKRLVELGFSESEVLQALQVCSGNADQAAAVLTAKKYGM